MKFLTPIYLSLITILGINFSVSAQDHVSLTLNIGAFSINQPDLPEPNNIDYTGSATISGNLRFFNKNHWALRLGAGVDQLNYSVTNNELATDYDAERKDFIGILGLEKHFILSETFTLYPGIIFPATFMGDESISSNIDNTIDTINNDGFFTGAGLVLGANLRFFRIMRLGVEFNATFDSFKQNIWQNLDQFQEIKIKNLDYTTLVTLGIAF